MHQKLLLISNIFKPTHIFPALAYSDSTKMWYVTLGTSSCEIWVADPSGHGCSNIVEHEPTPEEALDKYIQRLKDAEWFYLALKSKRTSKSFPMRYKKWDSQKEAFVDIKPQQNDPIACDVLFEEIMDVESMVKHLEAQLADISIGVMGTSIQRVMMDFKLLESYGLQVPSYIPKGKESYNVWCVGVGKIAEPKAYFYDWTIADAVKKALIAVKQHNGAPPTAMDELNLVLVGTS